MHMTGMLKRNEAEKICKQNISTSVLVWKKSLKVMEYSTEKSLRLYSNRFFKLLITGSITVSTPKFFVYP